MSRSTGNVNTRNAWLFFAITVVEAVVNCALEAVMFYFVASKVNIRQNIQARVVPTYLAIYILAFLFQVVFTFLAIRQRNTIQNIGLVIFNACFLAYSGVQITEIPKSVNMIDYKDVKTTADDLNRQMRPFLIVIPVITGIAQIAYTYLAYRIYQDFGWLVFKRLGADRKIHRYYFYYEIFACLLKFDFFFFVGFTIQLLIINIQFSDVEAWLTLAAIPVAIVFIILAVWSTRHEIHWLQALFDVAIIAGGAYFGVKLWRIFDDDTKQLYVNDRISLSIFACISIALLVCTLVVSVICQLNFGKGLKKYLVVRKDKEMAYAAYEFDDNTEYLNVPSTSGKGQRVLLD